MVEPTDRSVELVGCGTDLAGDRRDEPDGTNVGSLRSTDAEVVGPR